MPKAVSIVIQADGSITVDGKPAGPPGKWVELLELLKKKAAARKVALRAFPPPTVPLPPDERPRDVLISVVTPERTSYETFSSVLLACGGAELTDLDLQGVPFTLPGSSGCVVGPKKDKSPGPAFLPMEVRNTADLEKLREHAQELERGGILLAGTMECPMHLVIAAAKVIREIGAPVAFAIPYDNAAGTSAAPLVLKYTEFPGVFEVQYFGEPPNLEMLSLDADEVPTKPDK